MEIEHLYTSAITASVNVHTILGPGLNKEIYLECISIELNQMGISHALKKPVEINYKGITLNHLCIADVLLENKLLIQIKSEDRLKDYHAEETLALLKLMKINNAILVNFNESNLINGIKRILNNEFKNIYLNEP